MALLDIVDIYEVNRKECARLLLEYPKWTLAGTFKPKPGTPLTTETVSEKDWQLESTIIEVSFLEIHLSPFLISVDDPWRLPSAPRPSPKINLLHRPDHRIMQTFTINRRTCSGEVHQKALHCPSRGVGRRNCKAFCGVVCCPHEQFWVPMGMEGMVHYHLLQQL